MTTKYAEPGSWARTVTPKGWITSHDLRKVLRMNRQETYLLMRALVARWGPDDPCAPKRYYVRGLRLPRKAFWMVHESVGWFLVGRATALRYGQYVLKGRIATRRHRMPSELKKFLLHHDLRSQTSGIRLSISSSAAPTGSPLWLQALRKKGSSWSQPSR